MRRARACTNVVMLAMVLAGVGSAAKAQPAGPNPPAAPQPAGPAGPNGMPVSTGSAAQAMVLTSWSAPAGCPPDAQSAFARSVAAFVSQPPATPARVAVRITEDSGQLALWLRIDSASASGERTLRGPTCTVVVEAAAFIVALTIDPTAGQMTAFRPAPEVQGIADDELPPPLVPTDEQLSSRAPSAVGPGLRLFGSSVGLGVRFMVGGDTGTLPGYVLIGRGAVAARWRRWRLELGGSHLFEQQAPAAVKPGTGGLISATMAMLRGCVDIKLKAVPAFACASGELGRFSSQGYGPSWLSPVERTVRYAAVAGATGLDVPVAGSVRVRLDLELVRPLVRPRFQLCLEGTIQDCVEPLTTFWQPAQLSGRAFAGVEVTFR